MSAQPYRPVAPRVDVPATLRGLRIQAVRRGDELWARCPHPGHQERTPSWSIRCTPGRARHGFHKCMGCGLSGGVVELVEMVLDLADWRSALAWLEDRGLVSGQSVPGGVRLRSVGGAQGRREVALPDGAEFGPLETWPAPLRRYAVGRGLTAPQVERWGLGYVGSSSRPGMSARILLPVRDRAGRLVSWTARAIGRAAERKYLDPSRQDGADRGAVFGEQHWPADCAAEVLTLCEGELNALACERAGARCVGAIGGSGLDRSQNLRLGRFGSVAVATDVDHAGTKAAADIRAALVRWRGVRRVDWPRGQDACDVEKQHGLPALAALLRGTGALA